MRSIILASVCIILQACGSQPQLFKAADINNVYIADFVSDAPQQCKPSDVDLSNIQVKQFFQQAAEVEHKTLHDHYNYAPCAIEGTLTYQQQSCNWQVRAGATGYVQCAGEYRYFACDNCEQMFNPTTQN
ncbi:hypothetical protein GCM10009098_11410 [Rheinheimera aquimaris]|uniref:Lipoprotein n=1 Tax=Rheinheimera aquimaris TaxID=412437 RepID=A0ABN1DJY0_9GAMM|nr:hypothetical protein [Rheinheimera aquimaris]MCB5212982.1 hypothetical protein [Rheinheimera aquimaris]